MSYRPQTYFPFAILPLSTLSSSLLVQLQEPYYRNLCIVLLWFVEKTLLLKIEKKKCSYFFAEIDEARINSCLSKRLQIGVCSTCLLCGPAENYVLLDSHLGKNFFDSLAARLKCDYAVLTWVQISSFSRESLSCKAFNLYITFRSLKMVFCPTL